MSPRFARLLLIACFVLSGMVMTREPRAAELTIRGTISQAAWQVYCERFLDPSGRIIDDANGNISHTEGQGYGLLLALAADDRAGFERIWTFTQTEMLLRNDGLAVWKWLPTTPHVPDINNASDGDLLIAYALSLAGKAWSDDRYTQAATALAEALGKATVIDERGESLLLPGASGFATKDRADGPVINLSYWIFEALPVMQQLAPDTDWQALARSGLDLLASARFGDAGLPSEWISLHGGKAKPAAGFDPVFGYNALRIPFYLVRAGIDNPDLLAPFSAAWAGAGVNGLPIINVMTNQIDERLTDAGYRMLPALLACVRSGTKIPSELKSFTPTHYYPSTLYLLSISYLAERHAECL